MTDTLSGSNTPNPRAKRRGRKTGVGMQPHKRTGIDITMHYHVSFAAHGPESWKRHRYFSELSDDIDM